MVSSPPTWFELAHIFSLKFIASRRRRLLGRNKRPMLHVPNVTAGFAIFDELEYTACNQKPPRSHLAPHSRYSALSSQHAFSG